MFEIKELRKKQLLWMNVLTISTLSFFLYLLTNVVTSIYAIVLIGVVAFLFGVFLLISVKRNINIFKWARQLQDYVTQ